MLNSHELGSSLAGRKGNDTPSQLPFTLCLEGSGEDVGASSPPDQIPEGGEQLLIRQALEGTSTATSRMTIRLSPEVHLEGLIEQCLDLATVKLHH